MKKIKDIIVELFNRNSKSRIIVLGIVSILLVFLMLVGNTYSIFVSSNVDENVNVYKTGNLDVTYTLSEDNIGFDDIKPTSIEESIKIKPYRVTVNNAGTVPYMFDLILQDTTSTESISSEYIMVQVGKLEPIKLASTTNNIIKEDIIVPAGESVIVDVRVWLSDEVKNTEIGKSFYAKLVLDGLAVYADSNDIDNSVLKANRLLSTMEAGSYVAYVGDNGCVGDACSGVNANSSESSNGKCNVNSTEYNFSGWRIAYVLDGIPYLVSAGAPECLCTNTDGIASSTGCTTGYEQADGVPVHLSNLNNASLKYCNKNYVYQGMCNSSTTREINDIDFNIITGGTLSSNDCFQYLSSGCGAGNDLIETGGDYWFYKKYEHRDGWTADYLNTALAINGGIWNYFSSHVFGVRPVIKLDTTVVVTGGTGIEDDPYTIENIVPNSLKAFNTKEDNSYFHNEAYRTKIKNISFVDYIDTSDAEEIWDMSRSNNESIIAWVNDNEDVGYYDLYIGSEKPIKGINLAYYFSDMNSVDSIDFSNLDTSITNNMSHMFYNTGYDSTKFTLDLGDNFDTSNVTNMSYMFQETGHSSSIFTLDLGDNFDTSNVENMIFMFFGIGRSSTVFTLDLGDKFDTSNVVNTSHMFQNVGISNTNFTLDLGDKFDTSNVTAMVSMFYSTGIASTKFTLDLGDKFDTSKVTNMSYMFRLVGDASPVFTLDLGDKFDTSNVTNMSYMFNSTGYNSTVFTLDLGNKFDTSKVEDMSYMFAGTGYDSTVLTLDLGNKFDTSKVTNMKGMFSQIGYSSRIFTLDLGDKFDTSSVTNMNEMFYYTGYNSTKFTLSLGNYFNTSKVTDMHFMFAATGYNSSLFTLDLGDKFDTSSVTTMNQMFTYAGYSNTSFVLDLGEKFNTSNVVDMTGMFYQIGYSNSNLELDLTGFTFSKVTSYNLMFSFKNTQKIYVKNTSDQTWITSKGFSNVTTSNVLVKS